MVKKAKDQQLEDLNLKVEELDQNYRRALADYHNQSRRFKEQELLIVKMANSTLIEKFLANLDSLEMAQAHLKDARLQIVISQMRDTLSQEGLKPIIAENSPFDPFTMDCTEVVPGPKDQVMAVVTPGFYLFDKVLRPAKVKVGNGVADFNPDENQDL